MRYPEFCGAGYRSQSTNFSAQKLMNWYVQYPEKPGAKSRAALYPAPGFAVYANLPQAPVRGLFHKDGRCFAVGGTQLYELTDKGDGSGNVILRGNVELDTNPVTFCTNGDGGDQLASSSGDRVYLVNLTDNTFTEPTGDVTFLGFVDGYIVALDATTSTLKISNRLNGSVWDPTQFAQRTAGGDKWKSMIVAGRLIYLIGSESGEVWWNAGRAPFPFAPIDGAFFEHGIGAPFSLAKMDNVPVWLSSTGQGKGMVVRADGFQPVRISDEGVEYAISTYSRIDDAVGFTYQDQGHMHYVLNFPTARASWSYDALTNLWAERGYHNSVAQRFDAYRPQYHCVAFGHQLVGDRETGAIFRMSVDLARDVDGKGIRRIRRAPHLAAEGKDIAYDSFEIDMEVGVGLKQGQGVDPQVMLRVSRDAGKTWGVERMKSAGKMGEFSTRVKWNRIGSAKDTVFEVSTSDPVPFRITDAYLELEAEA